MAPTEPSERHQTDPLSDPSSIQSGIAKRSAQGDTRTHARTHTHTHTHAHTANPPELHDEAPVPVAGQLVCSHAPVPRVLPRHIVAGVRLGHQDRCSVRGRCKHEKEKRVSHERHSGKREMRNAMHALRQINHEHQQPLQDETSRASKTSLDRTHSQQTRLRHTLCIPSKYMKHAHYYPQM